MKTVLSISRNEVAVFSLVTLALLAGCSKETAPGKTVRPPVPVLAAKAEVRTLPVELRAVGNVQAYAAVGIRSQITGPIVAVHFEEGQEVKAGDRLFTIDPRPSEAALNQARANVKRDEALLLSARLEFQRTSNLFQIRIASQQDYDTAEASFRSAEAALLATSAAVSNAQVSLGYTEIRSPITGRTGDLKVKAGNVVKAPDDVLVNITQIHPIYAAFSVPEQNLAAVRSRMRSETLPVAAAVAGSEMLSQGRLTFINNMVDTDTGTVLLKATFDNEDNALWPGQFVQVSLALSNLVDAVVVPSQAVQTGQHGDYVFIAKSDDTVEMRPVVSSVSRDGITVITRGIQAGETVVTDGQLRLVPGAKVSVKPSDLFTTTNAALPAK
ncbi:MAG: efflux RND transporter periplasmic adaptor subunit [Verrucomicrobiota bacterium]